MNNSYITIIKEKRTVLSRKRVPLNQNECTADFRIGVPFEQNLHDLAYQREYRLAFGHKIPDDHFIRIGILENIKILRSEKLKDMYFSIGYTSHLKSDE